MLDHRGALGRPEGMSPQTHTAVCVKVIQAQITVLGGISGRWAITLGNVASRLRSPKQPIQTHATPVTASVWFPVCALLCQAAPDLWQWHGDSQWKAPPASIWPASCAPLINPSWLLGMMEVRMCFLVVWVRQYYPNTQAAHGIIHDADWKSFSEIWCVLENYVFHWKNRLWKIQEAWIQTNLLCHLWFSHSSLQQPAKWDYPTLLT